MSTGDDADAFLASALDFLQMCVSSTQLKKYATAFDPSATELLGEGLTEGLAEFQSDLARWGLSFGSPDELFDRLLLAPNLQATYFYRISHALHARKVELIPDVIGVLSRFLTGVEIYYSASIGPGLKVIHGQGALIGGGCTIGSHFTIFQNATVGDRFGKTTGQRPVIDDYVIASAGAQIIGPVTIGSRCVIGANSLVLHSVPENSIAAGVPAKIRVANMEEDAFLEYWRAVGE